MNKDQLAQYQAARQSVGLIDCSAQGKLEITGEDHVLFLHRMLTHDIESLHPGQGCYAALLNSTGKVLAGMEVYRYANSVLLLLDEGLDAKTAELLDKFIITESVEIKNTTHGYALLRLDGPKAEALLRANLGRDLPPLKPFEHSPVKLGSAILSLLHSGILLTSYFLLVPKRHFAKVKNQLLVSGKEFGILEVGPEAAEVLRIESGILRYGKEMTEEIILSETGLADLACSETKGCYPGQEVIAKIKTYGRLNRRMVGLLFEMQNPAENPGFSENPGFKKGFLNGSKIYSAEKEIGWITSACFSPTLQKGLALGYVMKGFYEDGTEVTIKSADKSLGARITTLPFISLSLAG